MQRILVASKFQVFWTKNKKQKKFMDFGAKIVNFEKTDIFIALYKSVNNSEHVNIKLLVVSESIVKLLLRPF